MFKTILCVNMNKACHQMQECALHFVKKLPLACMMDTDVNQQPLLISDMRSQFTFKLAFLPGIGCLGVSFIRTRNTYGSYAPIGGVIIFLKPTNGFIHVWDLVS